MRFLFFSVSVIRVVRLPLVTGGKPLEMWRWSPARRVGRRARESAPQGSRFPQGALFVIIES